MAEIKYQIFISSTYKDLVEERDGIIKAVLELYHIPIGMEMFSAEDEDQWEVIRRTIEVSDYYVLILGLRYGSKTTDGISFTQKEYEYAIERGIPVLAFIMNDGISLSKDKRDDDLTDINAFRNTVLENSKMAQFWATKDELLKNVSISLMKQIMQKPGIGWVRGDKVISADAMSQELTNLSSENRELRATVEEFKSKLTFKQPKIELSIGNLIVGDSFNAHMPISMPEKINFNDIPDYLKTYLTEDEINNYNQKIPSQAIIDKFNRDDEQNYKINNYSSPLVIKISNTGTIKANNIYISITFPNDIFIIGNDTELTAPKNPIPFNPLVSAQNKYKKSLSASRINSPLLNNFIIPVTHTKLKTPRLRSLNQHWWTKIDGRQLTVKINDLLHTRCNTFDQEYMITPLRKGKHTISYSVICEEFEAEDNQIFVIDVQ